MLRDLSALKEPVIGLFNVDMYEQNKESDTANSFCVDNKFVVYDLHNRQGRAVPNNYIFPSVIPISMVV